MRKRPKKSLSSPLYLHLADRNIRYLPLAGEEGGLTGVFVEGFAGRVGAILEDGVNVGRGLN